MPRRRRNQCETSATSGPKVAELPSIPISSACARTNCAITVADCRGQKPGRARWRRWAAAAGCRSGRRAGPCPDRPPRSRSGSPYRAARPPTVDAEFRLNRGQDDDGGPQADATDGAEGQRSRQPPPRVGAVRLVRIARSKGCCHAVSPAFNDVWPEAGPNRPVLRRQRARFLPGRWADLQQRMAAPGIEGVS